MPHLLDRLVQDLRREQDHRDAMNIVRERQQEARQSRRQPPTFINPPTVAQHTVPKSQIRKQKVEVLKPKPRVVDPEPQVLKTKRYTYWP